MRTITLKLTDYEWASVKETYLYHPIFLNDDGLLEIDDINAFKEYLNDWVDVYTDQEPTNQNLNNLKSILSKLDKEQKIMAKKMRIIKTIRISCYEKVHTLSVNRCELKDIATINEDSIYDCNNYTDFYQVRNLDSGGVVFFNILKYKGKREYQVLYGNGEIWSSYGNTIKEAVIGGVRDGWLYTRNKFSL